MSTDLRNNLTYQLEMEINELGRIMVTFDGWIEQAQHAHRWATMGELATQRLEVQQRRSALMAERFGLRRRV